MAKKLIRTSVIVCLICCIVSCSTTYRVTYNHTEEWLQTTQDSSGNKTVHESMKKSTKVTAGAELQKRLVNK